MISGFLHRLVARPRVYDLVQWAVGANYVRNRLARHIARHQTGGIVLDIGGGTGLGSSLWSDRHRYICLDIDPIKIKGYRAKNPAGLAMLGDAADLPIRERSIDALVCTLVTHHLTAELLDRMLAECARVLKPDGRLILLDAVWAPRRPAGRLLWRYDRGSFPRPMGTLRQMIGTHFDILDWDEFAVFHRYFIAVGKAATGLASP